MSWLSDAVVERLTTAVAIPVVPGDRYELLEVIGAGGMGTVYRAFDAELGREVAIKVARDASDPRLVARLRTEASVLARLEHPGIVPVHDVGTLPDGRLFYVMKLVRGTTLTRFVEETPDQDRRLGVFERVCETIAFAHEHGLVHRDLKPDNIMVGAFGEVLVLDWGVAKVMGESRDDAGVILGTPGFMPPEQARGAADLVDRRADVFALCAMLAEMLPASAPKRLRAITTTARAEDPASRYPDAAALGADLARYRMGGAVRAYRESLWDRVDRFVTVNRTLILILLAYIFMRAVVALISR